MKYSLAIHKNGHETLDIKNYGVLVDSLEYNEEKLEDIITFTNDFENEEALIESLLTFNLIPKEYYNGTIGIRYYKNKDAEPRILKFGVSYKEDAHMFNIDSLIATYNEYLEDNEFMEAFTNQYTYLFKNNRVLSELIANISFIYRKRNNEGLRGEEYDLYRSKMRKFILTYCTHKNRDGQYAPTIAGIRELAMFSINYERKKQKPKENKFKNPNYIRNLKAALHHYEELLKTEGLENEEYQAYNNKIEKLVYDIILVSDYNFSSKRGDEYEITRH